MADLRQLLETLANNGGTESPNELMRRARAAVDERTPERSPSPNRARLIVALVATISVVATAVAVVLVRNTTSDNQSPLGPTTATTSPPLFLPKGKTHGRLFLVPTQVPAGFEAFRVAGGGQPGAPTGASGSPATDRVQNWVRLDDASERIGQRFSIAWDFRAGHADRRTGTSVPRYPLQNHIPGVDAKPVRVRGTKGFYAHGTLVWEEPKGRVVSIDSKSGSAEHLSRQRLLEIADGLRRRGDGGFEARFVPHGFRFTGENDGMASDGTNKRSVIYRSPDGGGFMLDVVDHAQKSPAANLFDPRAHIVRVRGFDAVATPMLYNGGGTFDSQTLWLFGSSQFVQWVEPGRVLVTLRSVGLDETELLAIARGLKAVDRRDWEAFTTQAPGRAGAVPIPKKPPHFTGEKATIAEVFRAAFDGDTVETVARYLEDGSELTEAIETTFSTVEPGDYSAAVHTIKLVDRNAALVTFSVLKDGRSFLDNQQGAAVKVDGQWLVRRATYCAIVEIGTARCPSTPTPTATGPPPANEAAARRAVTETFITANDSDTPLDERIALVDDPTGLRDAYEAARRSFPEALANYTVEVHQVRFLNASEASISYDLIAPIARDAPVTEFPNRIGQVVRVNGQWKVTRATVCGILGLAQAGGCGPR